MLSIITIITIVAIATIVILVSAELNRLTRELSKARTECERIQQEYAQKQLDDSRMIAQSADAIISLNRQLDEANTSYEALAAESRQMYSQLLNTEIANEELEEALRHARASVEHYRKLWMDECNAHTKTNIDFADFMRRMELLESEHRFQRIELNSLKRTTKLHY